jgi:hypothetical protein
MKIELPGVLQFLLAGAFVFLLPGCGGGDREQETEAVTSGEENPEEGASLQNFLPGKAVVGEFGEVEIFEGSMRFLFAEGGEFTLTQVGRHDRKASGTYEVKGPAVVIRIEDEQDIGVLKFPGGLPVVGGEIRLESGEDKIVKGRITAVQAHVIYGQVPRTSADLMKLLGTPLNEREKQYVGRWTGGDQEGQWAQIVREDHTYSDLHRGTEYDVKDGDVVSGNGHGIWTIANDVIYLGGFVWDGKKVSIGRENWEPYALEILSLEAGKVVCISGAVTEEGESLKSVERRIEEFEEPEMKPFNTPEALKGFDVLKAYEEAKDPEGEEGAPTEEESAAGSS